MKRERDEGLDAVKGFAIILVMIGHCIILNGLHDEYIYDAIAAIQMPLFMLISGYITGMKRRNVHHPEEVSEEEDENIIHTAKYLRPDKKEYAGIFLRRTLKYLLPFFSWMFITHIKNFFEELKLQLFALDRGLWFLMTLWIVTVVSMVAEFCAEEVTHKLWKNEKKKQYERLFLIGIDVYLFVTAIVYFLFFLQERSGNTFLSPALTIRYMPFYVLGFLWGLSNVTIKAARGSVITVGSCAFVCLIAAFEMVGTPDLPSLVIQMVASLCGSLTVFLIIRYYTGGIFKKALAFVGGYTLEIYVIHFRFARLLRIAEKGLMPLTKEALAWVLAAFALMSVLTAASIWLIKKVKIADLILFGNNRYGKINKPK